MRIPDIATDRSRPTVFIDQTDPREYHGLGDSIDLSNTQGPIDPLRIFVSKEN